MNEEERIIRSIKYIINQNYVDTKDDIIGILIKALNLIEKQSKEIEELKEEQCCMTTCLRKDKEKLFLEDKIKAKIEEVDYKMIAHQDVREAVKSILQSLLEKE